MAPQLVHLPPVLTPAAAQKLIAQCELRNLVGRPFWSSTRHAQHPTTDLDVWRDVPEARPLLDTLIDGPITDAVVKLRLDNDITDSLTLRVVDAFVCKYSAGEGAQRGLGLHTDGCDWSANVLLSDPSAFTKGGTRFPSLVPSDIIPLRGEMLVHSGSIEHMGLEITSGTRYILVVFLNVA
jgi:hypothetical protein